MFQPGCNDDQGPEKLVAVLGAGWQFQINFNPTIRQLKEQQSCSRSLEFPSRTRSGSQEFTCAGSSNSSKFFGTRCMALVYWAGIEYAINFSTVAKKCLRYLKFTKHLILMFFCVCNFSIWNSWSLGVALPGISFCQETTFVSLSPDADAYNMYLSRAFHPTP